VRRGAALAAAATVAAVAVAPPLAEAHGLVGRTDLPIPSWLFGWGAAIVLAASFAALGALWREPRLQEPRERRLFRVPSVVDVVLGVVGVAWFAVVVYAGLAGSQTTPENLAPTAIYVLFWVGLPVLSILFGDVFRLVNPWRSVGVALEWVLGRAGRRTRPYPERLGRWPAVAGILGFAWLELALNPQDRADPSVLATLALAYAAIQLAGIVLFGVERWTERGDAFGVYFNLFSRLSPWERRDGVLHLRPMLSGAPRWPIVPGSVTLLAVAIGSTTFDGFSNGPVWASLGPDLTDLFGGGTAGGELASSVGLLGAIAVIGGFYRLGIAGMTTVGHHPEYDARELTGRFVHSLAPIAFAYLLAHYFSLLVYQGQALGYLISNPLGDGSDIFGTAHKSIDYTVIGSKTIWYVQVAALVTGHVAGLVLAHDRALAMYKNAREATRSQYWMLVVMVGFTSLGLWLLSVIGSR
jgi:predicted outer membrane lipoprotein